MLAIELWMIIFSKDIYIVESLADLWPNLCHVSKNVGKVNQPPARTS
jgi:hypothetical protein